MPLIYRCDKGAPLTVEEIDGNFRELDQRLHNLEAHPEKGEGLGKIEVQNDHLTFHGTFGADFGTFPLPKTKLNACGPWQPQTSYQPLDLVTHGHALYSCNVTHTSTTWEEDWKAWKEVLALPPPSSSSLSLYEKATLPQESSPGTLAVLMEEEGASPIFFNGKTWQRLTKGENL